VLHEEHARLAATVVVLVHPLDLEPDRPVKRHRALVHRRGHRAHDGARGHCREEALVEGTAESRTAALRIDADEVHVGLVRVGLRPKSTEEPGKLSVLLRHERGVAEVDEEELREHRRHRAATPPTIDDLDHPGVVGGLCVPQGP
jgi:hypothetical protein